MKKRETVNKLRHERMDNIIFNSKDNDDYMSHFIKIMDSIISDYPDLEQEVKRQIEKKKRRSIRGKTE